MSTQTQMSLDTETKNDLLWSTAAGIVGGIVMGIILMLLPKPFLAAAIPALWGLNAYHESI